ncbi:2Fe-2S iron-sulfur cluster-binding protein [candidate division KSB1 bacterium]
MKAENTSSIAVITYLPDNRTVKAEKGTTILKAALDNDININHNCGGFCACSSCHVIIKSGMKNLSEITEEEEEQLEKAQGLTLRSRLACQSKVYGDVVLEIPQWEG